VRRKKNDTYRQSVLRSNKTLLYRALLLRKKVIRSFVSTCGHCEKWLLRSSACWVLGRQGAVVKCRGKWTKDYERRGLERVGGGRKTIKGTRGRQWATKNIH
jgi:hypothetical protein